MISKFSMRHNSVRGVVLFEVLLAVLVLALGITACLQALRHILVITDRSRELFDTREVAAAVMFDLWTAPELSDKQLNVEVEERFNSRELKKDFIDICSCEATMIALPEQTPASAAPESASANLLPITTMGTNVVREREQYQFMRIETQFSKQRVPVYQLTTFNIMRQPQEGAARNGSS